MPKILIADETWTVHSIHRRGFDSFAMESGPHRAPPPCVEWAGYRQLWPHIAAWAAGRL